MKIYGDPFEGLLDGRFEVYHNLWMFQRDFNMLPLWNGVAIGFCHSLTSVPKWLCSLRKPLEVLECPKLSSLPEGTSAEITSHEEENRYNFPYLRPRLGISADKDGYNCIPIPLLLLHLQSSKVCDRSETSSASSKGIDQLTIYCSVYYLFFCSLDFIGFEFHIQDLNGNFNILFGYPN